MVATENKEAQEYSVGEVVTATEPAVCTPSGEALTIQQALVELLNICSDIKKKL